MLDGCVGSLDGWLCRIKVPLGKDTSNIASYYSGHYCCYGITVQAVCDSRCRFTYLSCRSPGGTGDSRACCGTALSYFLQDIPRGFIFWVIVHTLYLHPCWFHLLDRIRKKMTTIFSTSICLNYESKLSSLLVYW